ncbi:MAG: N-acetyltransferase family protein [Ruminococcus sp.]|nr:N-acetyltransferase family protein [Ruminococcus sp.]
MEDVFIRIATAEDASALLQIYAPYVKNTAITFEYNVPSEDEFRRRIECVLNRYPYLVAEIDGEIVGYAYATAFHERPAYGWGVETSIYVKQDMKKRGIGKALYMELERLLALQNILNLNACIAYPETEDEYLTKNSVSFHQHLGYRLVGEFYKCGFKFNRWYNVVWMEKHIGVHSDNPLKVKSFNEIKQEGKL